MGLGSIGMTLCILVDEDEVVNTASTHGSGDSSLFSSALDFVKSNKVSS